MEVREHYDNVYEAGIWSEDGLNPRKLTRVRLLLPLLLVKNQKKGTNFSFRDPKSLLLVILLFSFCFIIRYQQISAEWYIDELIYVKLTSFISMGHLASSSSYLNIYQAHNAILIWHEESEIVEPWLDHPPLFSILTIPFYHLGLPRLLPIFLGSLNTLLIIYLVRSEPYEALLSGLIFTVFPFAVKLNSMMFLDNGSSFFFLLTLALTSRNKQKEISSALLFAGLSAGLSFLCKEIGAYSLLYLTVYLLFFRKPREDYKALLLAFIIAALYPLAGLLLNKDLFLNIIFSHLYRTSLEQPILSLTAAITEFTYDKLQFTPGNVSPILFISWISLGIYLSNPNGKIVKLGILSFLLTIITIRYNWYYSWIPIYPFFSMSLASLIKRLLKMMLIILPKLKKACS